MPDFTWMMFAVFPYIAVALAVIVSIKRFKDNSYSISSFSTQFLENEKASVGLRLWHWGLLPVLILHFFVLFFPKAWLKLIRVPTGLYVLEVLGAALGLAALVGITILIQRRISNKRLRAISKPLDFVVLTLLFLQILSGIVMAYMYRWGSAWAPHTLVPWLWSLIKLNPNLDYINTMPHLIKFHMFNAFLLVALVPFTKLIHFLAFPIDYILRPPQVVIWNRKHGVDKYN
ncbi:MAG: respiratory nitrate reductase subunit gamma [Candidatus Melainabacteria bacterium]|nr:respiratory nitrate reductase subunit gamma [Candidatus Melainabacteria bacterium]